jgi:hypothetical protein
LDSSLFQSKFTRGTWTMLVRRGAPHTLSRYRQL